MLLPEDFGNMGAIGSEDEPLLSAALDHIAGAGRMPRSPRHIHRTFKDSRSVRQFGTDMYVDEVPEGLGHLIKELQ